MAKKKKQHYFAVRRGHTRGVFLTWEDCAKQLKDYRGGEYKKFTDGHEAIDWLDGDGSQLSLFANLGAKGDTAEAPDEAPAKKTPVGPDYVIYTDGSCLKNPAGPGGWAFVAKETATGKVTQRADGAASTTNNRMELTAVIEALAFTPAGSLVELHSDSQYITNGITKWVPGWKKRGWKRAGDKPVLNLDLWQRLDALNAERQVAWHWVKGHANIRLNERCDVLAKRAAQRYAH